MRALELRNSDVHARIDPGYGADVLSFIDRRTGTDVLFSTPWRRRADAIREGRRPSTFDAVAGWLERYRGGWQTLCPNAGDPRRVCGAPVAFHGEASVVPWAVDHAEKTSARLHVELFSVPLRVDRVLVLEEASLKQLDTITNLSTVDLEFDYSSHPALGGRFLDAECVIETGAGRFTSDPDSSTIFQAGSEHLWPWAVDLAGRRLDLRALPGPSSSREVFGWLDEFSRGWASVTNPELELTVRVEWDTKHLPFAWMWQELNATPQFPWYRRARALAIEPASTITSGPDRRSVLRLAGRESVDLSLSVSLEERSR